MNKSSQRHHLLCIVCPQGCEIEMTEIGGKLDFAPGICRRGQDYARQELFNPCRVLTTTVKLEGADIAMLPVRTETPIPREKLELAMNQIAGIKVKAPVHAGDVIVTNVAGTSVNLIAARTIA